MRLLFFITLLLPIALHAQHVGIGTPTPVRARLQVNGAVGITSAIFGGDGAGVSFMRNAPLIGFNVYNDGAYKSMAAGNSLLMWLNTINGSINFDNTGFAPSPNITYSSLTRRMTIRNNGNLSLNAGEANASLYVIEAPGGFSSVAEFKGTNYTSSFHSDMVDNTFIRGGKTGSDVYINDNLSHGNVYVGGSYTRVGINVTNPGFAFLEVKQTNNTGIILVNSAFNNWEFRVVKNGTLDAGDLYVFYNEGYRGNFFHLDGLYYNSSDRRVKRDITPMNDIMDKVQLLQPLEYKMKGFSNIDKKEFGFVAQDMGKLFPELVRVHKSDDAAHPNVQDLHTMDYSSVGVIAIKAIQQQQQTISMLQEKIVHLRARLEALRSDMTNKP